MFPPYFLYAGIEYTTSPEPKVQSTMSEISTNLILSLVCLVNTAQTQKDMKLDPLECCMREYVRDMRH